MINHPSYSNTSTTIQTAHDAIDESISTNSVVEIEFSESVYENILVECEDEQEAPNGDVVMWGEDIDGSKWTVRLVR